MIAASSSAASASRSLVARVRDPALEREIKDALGVVPEMFLHLLPAPWLMRVVYVLGAYPFSSLSQELADMAFMVVSRDNACRYCAGVSRVSLRIAGFDDARIDALERDFYLAELDRASAPALDLARKISRLSPAPSARELDPLRELGLSERALTELVFTAARGVFLNRVATDLNLPPEPIVALSERPIFRLLKPLARRSLRARRAKWRARAPDPTTRSHYSELLPRSGVIPALSETLRWVFTEAWSASRLPARTRAMIVAVVARALGASRTEEAAIHEAEETGLSRDRATRWLTRLHAEDMDELEVHLIPLARETARPQHRTNQARWTAFGEQTTNSLLLEAVAACALANMLCRLELLTRDA
jgi:alkylhydroperoxidase family enzyme